MLVELRINNMALIESLNLTLERGLNVLTGETGTGKSIIIDSVSILLGGRSSQELIRSGCSRALVEGLFHCAPDSRAWSFLNAAGMASEEDDHILLNREISQGGRNVCRINGKSVPLGMYRELGKQLVDIHGQHEHQSLSNPGIHLDLLDAFGGGEILFLIDQVKETYDSIAHRQEERKSLGGSAQERARRIEFLKFQIEEIDQARLMVGEEERLKEERTLLVNAGKLRDVAERCYTDLFADERRGAAYDRIGAAVRGLQEMEHILPAFKQLSQRAEGVLCEVEELSRELGNLKNQLEVDPQRLEAVEERLQAIKQLERKYGLSIDEILAYRDGAQNDMEKLAQSEAQIEAIDQKIAQLQSLLAEQAALLSQLRQDAAGKLESAVCGELAGLGMTGTKFAVDFSFKSQPDGAGIDQVEFLMAANPGEPLKPLARIASGGELSRIMLALKTILAGRDQIPTLIFDEIDAGIGGRSLSDVARKLSVLSRSRQVICVTHSPQIAAFADRHLAVEKSVAAGRTRTDVRSLTRDECVIEMARMLGGEGLDEARKHALSMLDMADKDKIVKLGGNALL